MALFYSFKIERHEGSHFYCGLGATDDPAPDAPAKSFVGWTRFPWNGGVAPTIAELKAFFKANQKNDKGDDIPGTSHEAALVAQLAAPVAAVTDATPQVSGKNAKNEDVMRAEKFSKL